MTIAVPYKAIDSVADAKDPRQAILQTVGDLSKTRVHYDLVLLGIYFRSRKTKGGIIRPDMNVQEDMWQGKVGLVLKLGTTAYRDTPDFTFPEEDKVGIGDWAVFEVGNGKHISVEGYPCRLVRDINIIMRVDDPDIIY